MSEDSEDDREVDEDVDGNKVVHKRKSSDETIIRSGYLWKKGERRKVRVLLGRPIHTFISWPYISRLGRSVGSS